MNTSAENSKHLKDLVREKYSQIADQTRDSNAGSCCGAGCGSVDYTIMAEDYSDMSGYVSDADLGLGCGLPTQFAKISPGDTVIDLGSGAGNDCFVARALTGEEGRVIGVDFTNKMIEKAKLNASKLGFSNIEFRLGDIENLPLASDIADVVVSNCVLNLVPNKQKAFEETFRVLKNGGHFSVSDIVLEGELPDDLRKAAEMYAGCVSGAVQKQEYLDIVTRAGFTNVTVQKEKEIVLPDEILAAYLSKEQVPSFRAKSRILSITLYGEKPVEKSGCCSANCCN